MDSPHVAPPLHHGIDRHLPLSQPPPNSTPVASFIHRRLVADEKRRWDANGIISFQVMFCCAREIFDFSPPHLPSSANNPTPTSNPIRSPNPLGFIIDKRETKYYGEKWSESLFTCNFLQLTHTHLSDNCLTRQHPPHALRPQYDSFDSPIPSNPSQRWNEIRRWKVARKFCPETF
jgi:hypothetical protein